MHAMHNPKVDLNFLYLVNALIDAGSVSAAADRLGLSQSATSHALSRLRAQFKDQLFVKTRTGMRPTPTALRIGRASQKILTQINQEMFEPIAFSALSTSRTFTLGFSDMAAAVMLGRTTAHFAANAPFARLKVVNVHKDNIVSMLEDGTVDIVVGTHPIRLSAAVMQQALFKATAHVCIVRSDHPVIGNQLTLQQFVDVPHVKAMQSTEANDYVDRVLLSKGLDRKIAVELPYLLPLPQVVAHTDFLALVPRALAMHASNIGRLRILEPPIKPPTPVIKQYWHQRYKADAGLTWLKGMLRRLWSKTGEQI